MRYAKWTILTLIALVIIAFFHYTLPQRDVVRIVNTYQERQDLNDWTRIFWATPDDQSATLINRDVQFIQAVRANGRAMVYRNEDTGWGWPPYFKFDTANLLTEAEDGKSTADDPKWFVITHYGWRSELLSIFPNAVSMRPVSGPDVTLIPWVNIIIIGFLLFVLFMIRRMWRQFRERMIDPAVRDAGEALENVETKGRGLWGRFTGWLGSWKDKSRR